MSAQAGLRRRRIAGLALLAALGCDGSTAEPDGGAAAGIALSTTFTAAASGPGAARAFDRADALWLRLVSDAGTRFETTLPVAAGGGDIAVPIRIDARRASERLTLELELRLGAAPLFAGTAPLTLRRGAVTPVAVPVGPVVADIVIAPPARVLDAYGETLRLDAVARFATGDTIDGVAFAWGTADDAVARVGADGVVTAVKDGRARIVARAGPRADTVEVVVHAAVASVAIVPAVASVPLGTTLQLEALLADRRGNPIPDRPVEWRSSDPATVAVDADGRARALRVGLAQIEASSGAVSAAARVRGAAAPPGASLDHAVAAEPGIAEIAGEVRANGLATTVWAEWSRDPGFDGVERSAARLVVGAAEAQPFLVRPGGFLPGTAYHVRLVARNGIGTAISDTVVLAMPVLAPEVRTLPPLAVTRRAATLRASVRPGGAPTGVRFELGSSAEFGADVAVAAVATVTDVVSVDGTALAEVRVPVDGLEAGRLYYVRALAANEAGAVTGAAVGFATESEPAAGDPPGVTTLAPTAVTAAAAMLNGLVEPRGRQTLAWFQWGTDPLFGAGSATTAQVAVPAGAASAPLAALLTGLAPNTTYYVRAVAASAAGTATGSAISFTTLSNGGPGPGPPFVATQAASGIGASQATLNALVNPGGLATTAWFEWGTDPLLAGALVTPPASVGAGMSALAVSTLRSALSPGTTYYARAVAANAAGTAAGAIVAFTTLDGSGPTPTAPAVATLAASMIGTTTARFNGQANPNGAATTAWFEWGTDAGLAGFQTTPGAVIGSGTAGVAFAFDAPGLAAGTTYYVRAAAANAGGERRGAIVSFTTGDDGSPPVLPTVVTGAATDVEPTAATLNGTAGGGGLPGLVWFEWSADPWLDAFAATPAAPLTASGGTQSVSARITSLMPDRTYWYRAVASTAGGTVRGAILAFDTPDGPPGPGQPPAVLTLPPLLWEDGIKVQGEVDPRGAATTVWFEWGADPTLGAFAATPAQALGAGGGTQWVWDYVGGLAPGTTWYVRAAAQNAGGTSRGAILSITLPGS